MAHPSDHRHPTRHPDPFPTPVPPDARPLAAHPQPPAQPQFFAPGDLLRWCYRRHDFARHGVEVIQPVRVIHHDQCGLALWLAGGTPVVHSRLRGFEAVNPHDVPDHIRFNPANVDRVAVGGHWYGRGIIRLVPYDMPFSVWLFRGENGKLRTRYINVENRHWIAPARDAHAAGELYTSDHVLDVVIPTGGHPVFKDEDELAAAVAHGQWSAEVAATIRANAQWAIWQYRVARNPGAAGTGVGQTSAAWAFTQDYVGWNPPAGWDIPGRQCLDVAGSVEWGHGTDSTIPPV